MADGEPPHAWLLPYPAQGHINPMLHLAKRLLSLGFTLTVVNTQPFHSVLEQAWGRHSGVSLASVSDPVQGKNVDDHDLFINSPQLEFRQEIEELVLERIYKQNLKISCIIFDSFLPWTPDLCHKYGIASVAFWTPSLITHCVNLEAHRLYLEGIIPVKSKAASRECVEPVTSIPGIPQLNPFDLPWSLHNVDPFDAGYLSRVYRSEQVNKSTWVLANTFEALEPDALKVCREHNPKLLAVGPLLPAQAFGYCREEEEEEEEEVGVVGALWEENVECLEWLDNQLPLSVLYISFGSVADLSHKQVEEIALGLELSKQPFLWVFRPGLVRGASRVLLDEFIKRTKDQGLVISWSPQLKVLQHPSVGGFLSHCGWNSTLESICIGVPMLGWPCMAEQPLNLMYIADVWKIGLRFNSAGDGIVHKEEIARVITKLMREKEGEEMRMRVQELKHAGKEAGIFTGLSYNNLHTFAQEMRAS